MLEKDFAQEINELIYRVGILGHQQTRLHSGRVSPYYFEFANILGHPLELVKLAKILAYKTEAENIQYDRIVPGREGGTRRFRRVHSLTNIEETLNYGRAAIPPLISEDYYREDINYYYANRVCRLNF